MPKISLKKFIAIFVILISLTLSIKYYIDNEKQRVIDNEMTIELHEEQNVQESIRKYILAIKRHDIENYNSVVTKNLKINSNSLYFSMIMSNVIDAKFMGDNLSAIHIKKEDSSTTILVKYEITFPKTFNPVGVYREGKNSCKVFILLEKEDNLWFIKKTYNLKVDTYS